MDVYTGLGWKTGVREWLIGLGLPPSNVFDHLYALYPRAGSSELLAMSERWQPVPRRDNINGSEPLNPANINRSQLSQTFLISNLRSRYFSTPVRVRVRFQVCARAVP
ncbi:hypothetical protein B0H13DRAFT_1929725 [Mycena leptocephala]|nr:hypothetical protein B0H13DRAFT_1929725 [Mycena leptocephala]